MASIVSIEPIEFEDEGNVEHVLVVTNFPALQICLLQMLTLFHPLRVLPSQQVSSSSELTRVRGHLLYVQLTGDVSVNVDVGDQTVELIGIFLSQDWRRNSEVNINLPQVL